MAERSHWWTDRWLRSPLFVSLSFSFSDYLSTYLPTYLHICLSIYLPTYLFVYLSIDLSVYLSICLSICLSIYLSVYLSFYLSTYLSIYLSLYLSISLSLCLSVYLSASLKMKLFCETSSVFKFDNIKNAAIQRDFLILWDVLQKWKVECRADGLVPMRFAIVPVHLSKLLRLPRKSDARSYEVLHLSRKIISANLKIWCSKMQPCSGNQRPDLLTTLMIMSLVPRLPRKMHLCRSSSNVPHLPSFLDMLQNPHILLTFDKVHNPLRLPRETTSERPKVVRSPGAFNILTSKCASRHNGVQFLARWLRTGRFSEPTFRPSGATNHVSRLSYLFAHLHLLSSNPFFSLIFSLLLFSSLLFFDSYHLCFSSVHIVRSLTSKLPSINHY